MTVGIYKLIFNGTSKVYIGQSIHIEKRFQEHLRSLRNNKASRKLQLAYNNFGIPKLECVIDCDIHELDELETLAIKLNDSFNNGFNSLESPFSAPRGSGEDAGNSIYNNAKIEECFKLLVYSQELTANEISELTGVERHTISKVSCLSQHIWLKDKFPEEYAILEGLFGTRSNYRNKGALALGIVYPLVCSPNNEIFVVEHVRNFAKIHGLAANHLTEVLNGRRKSHKGWKVVCQDVNQ